jgi:glycosyltransferase involved in cell wall biosynthesis
VVDDGSSDRTSLIIKSDFPSVQLLQHKVRKGKGAALRTALSSIDTPYIALQDADEEYPPENLVLLALQDGFDMVVGQRKMIMTDFYRQVEVPSFVANKIFAHIANVPDAFSGQRILRTDFMKSLDLQSNGFEVEMEMTIKSLYRGAKIKYVPIDYYPRTKEMGKKINILDFLKIVGMYLRLRMKNTDRLISPYDLPGNKIIDNEVVTHKKHRIGEGH